MCENQDRLISAVVCVHCQDLARMAGHIVFLISQFVGKDAKQILIVRDNADALDITEEFNKCVSAASGDSNHE